MVGFHLLYKSPFSSVGNALAVERTRRETPRNDRVCSKEGNPLATRISVLKVWAATLVLLTSVANGQSRPSSEVRLLYFTAQWCGPCQQMKPALLHLQQRGWQVDPIDTDRQPQLVDRFEVRNLPTMVILGPNGEIDRIVGVTEVGQVERRLKRAAARYVVPAENPLTGASASSPSKALQLASDQQPSALQSTMTVRGQSPGVQGTLASANRALQAGVAMSSARAEISPQQAMARAAAATVRIRVDEGNATAHGTGTIVDTHGDEALVLTCGHLFRDMRRGTQISVDLFAGTPREINLPAQLIDFRAEEEDIGLISFRLPISVAPVPLLPRGLQPSQNQLVFSYGCDHGQNPTRRDTRILTINRYLGAENIEIAGAPAVGRSGGGLFDMEGRLIGVCNAADAEGDEGIYASASVIYNQIDRLGLGHLFRESPQSVARGEEQAAASLASATRAVEPAQPSAWPDTQLQPAVAATSTQLTTPAARASEAPVHPQQLICVVRSADGQEKVVTINQPSRQLLETIHEAASSR
jgi:thiol-disulfide isomerase/thioredoxin